ncbi:uncharacterized protein LOC135205429 isoform X2 [Macrobrachium nipponense]|uniref:uncharacterized protein LOC135205429 isoform X2 n=1 Tax=Macrobrachium nipponense TaxID=159736 RepID=UPI0030C7F579
MDDTDTEPAETEPLVRHGRTTTGVGGGTTPPGDTAKPEGASSSSSSASRTNAPPRTPSRLHLDSKPRLSLVPESNERSLDEDQQQPPEGGGGGSAPLASAGEGDEAKKAKKNLESPTPLCPFFGVRNYLHQFYEKPEVNDPSLYEDLQPTGGVSVIDRVASAHNAQVDALLLVGLVAVTLGSTVVAAALISRTFCSRPEEYSYPFRVGQYVLEPPISPIERKVPATEKLTQVQPNWGTKGFLRFP